MVSRKGARLRKQAKKLSLDLSMWVQDANEDDLLSGSEIDEFENCAARIAEIGGLMG